MRKYYLIAFTLLPSIALASFQIAGATKPRPQGRADHVLLSTPAHYQVNQRYTLHTHIGSLEKNVSRYLAKHGWLIRKWQAKKTIAMRTRSTFTGNSVTSVMKSLFSEYPGLKVSFDKKHRHITVKATPK